MNHARDALKGRVTRGRKDSVQGAPRCPGPLSQRFLVHRIKVPAKNLLEGIDILFDEAWPKGPKHELLILQATSTAWARQPRLSL